jgi:hypothetical protein
MCKTKVSAYTRYASNRGIISKILKIFKHLFIYIS